MENHIKILIKKGLVLLLFFIFITLLINLRLTLRFKNYSLLDRCVTNSFIINSIIFNKGNMYVNDSIQFATSYKNDTQIVTHFMFIEAEKSIGLYIMVSLVINKIFFKLIQYLLYF